MCETETFGQMDKTGAKEGIMLVMVPLSSCAFVLWSSCPVLLYSGPPVFLSSGSPVLRFSCPLVLLSSCLPVLQVDPSGRDLWEVERDRDVQSSGGYGLLRSSVSAARTASLSPAAAPSTAAPDVSRDAGTATPETDTGTDFGLPGTKGALNKKQSSGTRLSTKFFIYSLLFSV